MQALKRQDWQFIAQLVEADSKVLDVGCGRGTLLKWLQHHKNIDARGLEIDQDKVSQCIANGLAVVHGDASADLVHYPDNGFDYAILSQTLQTLPRPYDTMRELARLARFLIIAIPNFGHWRVRFNLLWRGRMPKTSLLDAEWFNTPNIHFCTIKDFLALCAELALTIDKTAVMTGTRLAQRARAPRHYDNWLAEQAVFLLHSHIDKPRINR